MPAGDSGVRMPYLLSGGKCRKVIGMVRRKTNVRENLQLCPVRGQSGVGLGDDPASAGNPSFLTIRTGFIQRKTITKGIPLSVSKEDGADGEVSQFGALTTALASTIGTGNIIGVGTAIALGGPGAVLWCWLTGVFGIATKYSESLIAVKYRVKTEDGRMQGGAMYALERGLNMKWLGMIFAVFAGFASFGIGCATQVNAIAEVCNTNLGVPAWIVGVVIAILTCICYLWRNQVDRKCL